MTECEKANREAIKKARSKLNEAIHSYLVMRCIDGYMAGWKVGWEMRKKQITQQIQGSNY